LPATKALQKQLTRSLQESQVWSAGYPQLQPDANFPQDLQTQLAETESSIAARTRPVHGGGPNFNNDVQTFPTDVTAECFDSGRGRISRTAAEK